LLYDFEIRRIAVVAVGIHIIDTITLKMIVFLRASVICPLSKTPVSFQPERLVTSSKSRLTTKSFLPALRFSVVAGKTSLVTTFGFV